MTSADAQAISCEIDGQTVPVKAGDLTLAGVFIQTTFLPRLDDELTLHLFSPIGQLELRGQVVQLVDVARATRERRRPGFGVLFTDLSDDQRAWIGLSLDAQQRARKTMTEFAGAPSDAPMTHSQVRSRVTFAPPSHASSLAPPKTRNVASERAPKEPRPAKKAESPEVVRARAHKAVEIAASLRKELAQLQSKPPWSVLGITSTSTLDEAKEAFLAISKRCHPHLYAQHESPEVSKLATELFITYKRAYSVLTKLAPRDSNVHATGASRATMRSIAPAGPETAPPPARTTQPPNTRARTR